MDTWIYMLNLHIDLYMFSVNNSISSKGICDMFRKNSEIHSYSTRQCNANIPKSCRSNIRKFTTISCLIPDQ